MPIAAIRFLLTLLIGFEQNVCIRGCANISEKVWEGDGHHVDGHFLNISTKWMCIVQRLCKDFPFQFLGLIKILFLATWILQRSTPPLGSLYWLVHFDCGTCPCSISWQRFHVFPFYVGCQCDIGIVFPINLIICLIVPEVQL